MLLQLLALTTLMCKLMSNIVLFVSHTLFSTMYDVNSSSLTHKLHHGALKPISANLTDCPCSADPARFESVWRCEPSLTEPRPSPPSPNPPLSLPQPSRAEVEVTKAARRLDTTHASVTAPLLGWLDQAKFTGWKAV